MLMVTVMKVECSVDGHSFSLDSYSDEGLGKYWGFL